MMLDSKRASGGPGGEAARNAELWLDNSLLLQYYCGHVFFYFISVSLDDFFSHTISRNYNCSNLCFFRAERCLRKLYIKNTTIFDNIYQILCTYYLLYFTVYLKIKLKYCCCLFASLSQVIIILYMIIHNTILSML